MKKIISIFAILALIAAIFTFAACGKKTTNDIKNEITTLKDDGEDMMDDMSSALGELDDELTENGNVTDENSSTGLSEDITDITAEDSTDLTKEEATTTTTTNQAQ